MSPVRVSFSRTVGRALGLSSTALAVGGFLAASALLFAFGLEQAEGGTLLFSAVWASCVAKILPVLVAVLAMDVWSDERQSGRLEFLLVAPVHERDLVLGKFLGVFATCMASVVLSLATSILSLDMVDSSAVRISYTSFLPALFSLALQGMLWSAVSLVASAMCRHAAAAACISVAVLCGIPRGVWAALLAWAPAGRASYGEMPLDAHVTDMSMGVFSSGTIAAYVVLAIALLYVCTKCVESYRLIGRGSVTARLSNASAALLSLALAIVVALLAGRVDFTAEIIMPSSDASLAARTRGILAESRGEIVATCFLPRNDARFRSVAHVLRALKKESSAQGGAVIELRYIDPRWDIGDAQRLIRSGIPEDSVVFECGRRRVVRPISEGYEERMFASAILNLSTAPKRSSIYWATGHGEVSFEDYGQFGMSDIARELSRDGFSNRSLDVSGGDLMPADCALVIIAGPKEDFSRVETDRIDAYLKQGGRLLMLFGDVDGCGFASVLSAWGLRLSSEAPVGAKTLSGNDVIASTFADHAVTESIVDTRIVFEKPISLEPSAVSQGSGVDGVGFTELVRAGGRCLAAAVERGNGSGSDIALRPTRIVVIGDSMLAMNGQLSSRGNANRDFFLNCVAYLAGTGAITSGGSEDGVLSTGMDRDSRIRFVLWSVGICPFSVFALLVGYVAVRRRRT